VHLREIVSVGIGGFVGAVLRYEVSGWVQHWSGSVRFPYGTLAVNILGSLIIGTLSELVEGSGFLGPQARDAARGDGGSLHDLFDPVQRDVQPPTGRRGHGSSIERGGQLTLGLAAV